MFVCLKAGGHTPTLKPHKKQWGGRGRVEQPKPRSNFAHLPQIRISFIFLLKLSYQHHEGILKFLLIQLLYQRHVDYMLLYKLEGWS